MTDNQELSIKWKYVTINEQIKTSMDYLNKNFQRNKNT